jgi:plastocyanin
VGWSPFGRRYYTTYNYPTYSYPVSTYSNYGTPVYNNGTVYSDPCRGVDGATDTAYDDVEGDYSSARPDLGERVHHVQMIQGVGFEPGMMRINAGDTVAWKNNTREMHTVTFDPDLASTAANVSLPDGVEPFDSGEIAPGDSFTHTFDTAGVYHYICQPHEDHGMVGTIVVREAATDAGAAPAPAADEEPVRSRASEAAEEELPLAEPPEDERY